MERPDQWIHPTAIIEDGARIGERTRIWQWVHVMPGARVGRGGSVGQGCYIGNVQIGDGCRIQNNVSVYDGVELADDVFLGPSCVFTNVKHPRAHVSRRHELVATRIGRGASIGANATVICGVSIGDYAMVGAGAVVTQNIPAHALVVGAPAARIGWTCRCGETLPDDLSCARCGDRYASDGAALTRIALTPDSGA